jgi:hypothetical protein
MLISRMGDTATIGSSIVLGVIAVLFGVTIVGLTGGSALSAGSANFLIMLSFVLVVTMVAIPFVEVNLQVAGMADNNNVVQGAILSSIGFTTAIFIGFLLVTFMILRRYPAQITTFVNVFTMLSFLMSLIVVTLYTLNQV